MEWYQNEKTLEEAVGYLLHYSCCYDWTAFASDATPCCNYKEQDRDIPDDLCYAIRDYLRRLPRKSYRELNKEISALLGERFFVQERALIKILSRMLSDGNPCEKNQMVRFALQMQVQQRMELLKTMRAC